jgi:hypothetical protein
MIEVLAQAIHAIMTIKTGGPKRQSMRRHKPQIHLTVATITCIHREGCDISVMAVLTGERLTRSRQLMSL